MSNKYLINFLQNIINKLEQDDSSDKEKALVFEIMCKSIFVEDIEKHTEENLMKYLSLGYYIYNNKQDL